MLSSLYQQKKRTAANGGFNTVLDISTAGTTQDVKAPKVSGLTLVFQRIRVHVLTGGAYTWQFRAKTTTTTVLSTALDMSTAGAFFDIDFGPKGFAIPAGETLEVLISGAGAAGRIEVEGYYA
jgi:hypothetical protein